MTKKPAKVGPVGERGGADMSRTETAIARESEIGGHAGAQISGRDDNETPTAHKPSQRPNPPVKK